MTFEQWKQRALATGATVRRMTRGRNGDEYWQATKGGKVVGHYQRGIDKGSLQEEL